MLFKFKIYTKLLNQLYVILNAIFKNDFITKILVLCEDIQYLYKL